MESLFPVKGDGNFKLKKKKEREIELNDPIRSVHLEEDTIVVDSLGSLPVIQ